MFCRVCYCSCCIRAYDDDDDDDDDDDEMMMMMMMIYDSRTEVITW